MSEPHELLKSTDPEELFEAATTFNLSQMFLQKSGRGKGAVLSKGWYVPSENASSVLLGNICANCCACVGEY